MCLQINLNKLSVEMSFAHMIIKIYYYKNVFASLGLNIFG